MSPRRIDLLAAAVLCAAMLLIFGAGAPRLGFYGDDAGWLHSLPSRSSVGEVWGEMRNYVPGRNLHPLWQWLVYRAVGHRPVERLTALHFIQTAFDALTVAVFYFLLRRLSLSAPSSLIAAACFAFWPVHGETHLWLAALPQNILSTLFALLFVLTWLELKQPVSWRLYGLDLLAFSLAVFTYEQVLPPLLLLVVLRWRLLLYRAPHLVLAGFAVWLRLTRPAGLLPRADWAAVLENIRITAGHTWGSPALHVLAPVFGNATRLDRWLAVLVAAAVTGLALYLWRGRRSAPPAPVVLLIALTSAAAAYATIWLWYLSPRHHYLPSAPLFLALAWILDRFRHPALILALAPPIYFGAATGRGESRYWEAAFAAKMRLMQELRPQLQDKQALVLSGFPMRLETAPVIAPHDAHFTPQLLFGLPARWHGYLGYAPAPGGYFLRTHTLDGPYNFFFSPGHDVLVARFTGWSGDVLRFDLNPQRPLPYEVRSSRCAPEATAFAPRSVEARRQADDLGLTLDYATRAATAAIVQFPDGSGWHPWGEADPSSYRIAWPVWLTGSAGSCTQSLLLRHFPEAARVRVEFYAMLSNHPVEFLGRTEVPVGR